MPRTATTLERFIRPQANVQALIASLTCPGCGNCQNFNSKLNSFVFKELSQLVERPIVRSPSLSLISGFFISPFADASQVFNGDSRIIAQGIPNNRSTDSVVSAKIGICVLARTAVSERVSRPSCLWLAAKLVLC